MKVFVESLGYTGSVKLVVKQHLSKYVVVVDASSYVGLDTIVAYKVKVSNYLKKIYILSA